MTCVKTYWPAYIGAPAIKTSRRGRKTPEKIQVDNESKRHFTENYQLVILSSTNNVGTPVTMHLYSRLASAIILQRRERTNRLLSVDAVTAAIAHELRTPLGAIALNASTALSQLRSNPPELEEMDDILSDIEAESHRAGAMISSIRELSKKTTDRRAPTRVEDVARLSLRLLQH